MGSVVEHGDVLWSVMIPTYNPSVLLKETLQSLRIAVDRAHGRFQVELVDDASPNGSPEPFAREAGMPVICHVRASNGGLATCWNECIARARGALIHILHQDDVVLPDFYREMENLGASVPEAGMLFCRALTKSRERTSPDALEQEHAGIIPDWLEKISAGQRLLCPSVVVRSETYKKVGGFDARLKFVVDWEMWVRIAASGAVAYHPTALVEYRVHDQSETARLKSSGCITDDLVVAYRVLSATLQANGKDRYSRGVLNFLVWCSWDAASSAERQHNFPAARREAWSALTNWWLLMRPKQTIRNVSLIVRSFKSFPVERS